MTTDNDVPMCSQANCEQPAAVKYHWLSQPMFACTDHTPLVAKIGAALSLPVHFEPLVSRAKDKETS